MSLTQAVLVNRRVTLKKILIDKKNVIENFDFEVEKKIN